MSKENTITKIQYKKFRQLYCNGKFDLLAIASKYMELDGFTVKPGMMIYQARNKGHKDVFFVAFGPDFNCRGFVYGWLIFGPDHFLNTNMLREYQFRGFKDAVEESKDLLKKLEFESACKEADMKADQGMRLGTIDGEELELTDVVPGDRCNNGGEYGFYTCLQPTEHPGVFWRWTWTTCDFDKCDTSGYEGGEYAVYTQAELDAAIEESEAIKAAGSLYGGYCDDYDEYYYDDDDDE